MTDVNYTDEDFELITDWPKCAYSVVGIILQDELGRMGMQLRDDIDGLAGRGLWSIFGGHMDAGETAVQTAIRELKEETGIIVKPDELEPMMRLVPDQGVHAYHYYFRVKRAVAVAEISVGEGAGFAFLNYGQYQRYEIMKSASLVCEHLYSNNEFAL